MKKIFIALLLAVFMLTTFGGLTLAASKKSISPRNLGLGFEIMLKAKADVLGISVEALQNLLDGGKKFIDIAKDKNLTQEQVCQSLKTQMQTKLQTMVTGNILTQAQADRWNAWVGQKQEKNGDCLNQGFFGTRAMGKGLGRYYNWK